MMRPLLQLNQNHTIFAALSLQNSWVLLEPIVQYETKPLKLKGQEKGALMKASLLFTQGTLRFRLRS